MVCASGRRCNPPPPSFFLSTALELSAGIKACKCIYFQTTYLRCFVQIVHCWDCTLVLQWTIKEFLQFSFQYTATKEVHDIYAMQDIFSPAGMSSEIEEKKALADSMYMYM